MLISVLVPVHRSPGMVLTAIGSALSQTHRDIEVLVGVRHWDEEGPVIEQAALAVASIDRRVRVIRCDNCSDAFEKVRWLVRHAEADWVAGLDYDDIWLENKLQAQIPYLNKYDVVSTGGAYFGNKTGCIPLPAGELTAEDFRQENPVMSTSAILRSEDAMRLDPDYRDWAYDYKLYVDLHNAGRKFFALPEQLVLHRIHSASTFNTRFEPEVHARIRSLVK